uniref:Cathepsin K n=1 Tax=Paramormyrops kingsleyae TaxID=1676925 RepID=A0A3B3R6M2_9TELE
IKVQIRKNVLKYNKNISWINTNSCSIRLIHSFSILLCPIRGSQMRHFHLEKHSPAPCWTNRNRRLFQRCDSSLQGSCGSCWAFSAVGALEGLMKKKTGKLVPLSPQNLVDCVTKSHGCKGGYMHSAFEYVRRRGIDTEEAYPYVAKVGHSLLFSQKHILSMTDCIYRPNGESYVKLADLSSSILGVYNDPRCRRNTINHAILVVGYSSAKRRKYWIIKNRCDSTMSFL